jgi:hypothetical protein
MEAIFFVCGAGEAHDVRSSDDVPGEPAAEPLAVASPGALAGLVHALAPEARGALRQLRDATCQSFPVWTFARELASALASLDEREVDAIAERWLASHADDLGDADLYELSLCIAGLRDALGASADGARLFVLLEEKAW